MLQSIGRIASAAFASGSSRKLPNASLPLFLHPSGRNDPQLARRHPCETARTTAVGPRPCPSAGPLNQGKFDAFITAQKGLVAALKKAGVKVVFLTPGCVDPDKNEALAFYNDTLEKFANGVKDLAAQENIPVYDIHALMLDVQTRGKAGDKGFTIVPDLLRAPIRPGQAIMAYGLLNALGANEQPSGLRIDAAYETALPDRCSVRDLKVTESSVDFVRTDEALPTHFDADCAAVYKYLPIEEDVNQYRFCVTALKAGMWKLVVQGLEVGIFSSHALAGGINLASLPGPWKRLGEDVNLMASQQEDAVLLQVAAGRLLSGS